MQSTTANCFIVVQPDLIPWQSYAIKIVSLMVPVNVIPYQQNWKSLLQIIYKTGIASSFQNLKGKSTVFEGCTPFFII